MTDEELRVKIKESPALTRRKIFDDYCNYVYAIVINKLRICGRREDIEECVIDVFAEFFRMTDKLDKSGEDIKSIIGVIAKRRAIDTYRRLSRENGMEVSIDDDEYSLIRSEENIEENAEHSERNALLLKKLHELGEPDSTILIQQYYYNRSSSEIAKTVSMTAAAVQKRSIRARGKLKIMLSEIGVSL